MNRSLALAVASMVAMVSPLALAESTDGTSAKREFAMEIRLLERVAGKEQVQSLPKVTLFEGQRATISDLVQRPFVVAVSPQSDASLRPCIEVVSEGLTLDLVCHANGPDSVTLDATAEQSKIVKVDAVQIDEDTSIQQPHVKIAKSRHFVTTNTGKVFTIPLDGRKAGSSQRRAVITIREVRSATR